MFHFCFNFGTIQTDFYSLMRINIFRVDYIDCLGRTRKCLQKDLNYLKSQDEELKNTIEARKQNKLHTDFISGKDINNDVEGMNEEKDMIKDKNDITEESEMLSSHMRRELLRQQWEKEEEELRNKSDIHYQDILFGEARTHGVGYYGFSKDEEERAKQQEALRKLRDETEHKQKRAQELKALREKQLAARIKAAKNRKRTRLGLPPEEEEIQPTPESEISKDEKKKLEEFTQAEEEKQRALEEARKRHLRPWDVGKEGVKQHYVMSQEEWVEKKRAERPEEFAPPSSHRKEFRSFFKTLETEDTDKSLNFTTKKINRKEQKTNLNPYKSFVCNANSLEKSKNKKEETLKKKWYYEDKKDNFTDILENTDFQEINRSASVDPTPITNLCEEIDFDDRRLNDYNKIMKNIQGIDSRKRYSEETLDSEDNGNRGIGLEIAPPPTFNYYGPGHNKKPRTTPKATNIHESIEAGLKYLRRQVEEKEKSTKHPREIYLS